MVSHFFNRTIIMKQMKIQAKPSIRAEVVTRRTYNRPLDETGTVFESWQQTVSRVIDHQKWLWERAVSRKLNKKELEELAQFEELMLARKALVSGRTLWLGGTDVAKKRESSMFNCLGGETKILTDDGAIPIKDVVGNVKVVNSLGKWVDAEVSEFGEQELIGLKFANHNHSFVIRATANHNWVLSDGCRVPTKLLNFGDKIPLITPPKNVNDVDEYNQGVRHGLIYGDGSKAKSGSYSLRIYSGADDLIGFFSDFSITYPPSCKGAPNIGIPKSKAWCELKELPIDSSSNDYMLGFIRGWFAADGHVSKSGQSSICCGHEEEEWLIKNGAKYGFFVTGSFSMSSKTNFGERNKAVKDVRFAKASFVSDDALRSFHRDRVKIVKTEFSFQGVDRETPVTTELVYCATVPETHDFVLGNGMLTSNCSFTQVETVYDVVDCLWLLLQGCGVGFTPIRGTLNGFLRPIKTIEVIKSTRTEKGGNEHNTETWDPTTKTWTLAIGDSAESWAKSIGKLLAGKFAANKLTLDFSNIRPSGERLKGYGWISSGDDAISKAYVAIAELMNRRAGSLLTAIDILDIMNHLGTVLSSRRSAEIALLRADDPEWKKFATAKKDMWDHGNGHREQSNNSLVFYSKPSRERLEEIFALIINAGGSEPGFINGEAALRRAPWFKGCNPCAEILLGNKSFCNLTEVDIGKFHGDSSGLRDAVAIAARANYRQTCVNLKDGVLQEAWHLNNEFLRLCGVGLTGIARRNDLGAYDYQELQRVATSAAFAMADELGTAHPKNVTTVKPSGTLSKIMDTAEGVHTPLGRYVFNNINFSKHDPIVKSLKAAGYKVIPNPADPESMLVTFPVAWDDIEFTNVDGVEINIESAVSQLDKYKLLQNNWTQQNTSVTISYDPCEVPSIIDWLLINWDLYVGVSFIYRTDPTKTAADLGYKYLPQEIVTKATYDEYIAGITDIDIDADNSFEEITDADCVMGVCPVK